MHHWQEIIFWIMLNTKNKINTEILNFSRVGINDPYFHFMTVCQFIWQEEYGAKNVNSSDDATANKIIKWNMFDKLTTIVMMNETD